MSSCLASAAAGKVQDGQDTGPSLLEDPLFREKKIPLRRERTSEHIARTRRTFAHGFFIAFKDSPSKFDL
jgi:catalase